MSDCLLTKRLLERLEAVGKKKTLNPLSVKVLNSYFVAGVSFAIFAPV
jgi:hypothetical protein